MSIEETSFNNDQDLADWVSKNFTEFVPGALYLPGFIIATASGKKGVPDGFAFDLPQGKWFVVEDELLRHGVWPHIAEQIVRFVVALQNQETRRLIRDNLFESLIQMKRSRRHVRYWKRLKNACFRKSKCSLRASTPMC